MITVRTLSATEAERCVARLAEILVDVVDGGSSVNFLWPFDRQRTERFWSSVSEQVAEGTTVLIVAELDGTVVGTVSVNLIQTENQPHRVGITKLLVHRDARRKGVASTLMQAAESAAHAAGRTLAVLDTTTDGDADRLYRRLGWTAAGTIPGYALDPDGTPSAATIFYKSLRE